MGMSPLTPTCSLQGTRGARASHGKAQPGPPQPPAAHAGTGPLHPGHFGSGCQQGTGRAAATGSPALTQHRPAAHAHPPRGARAPCVGPTPAYLPSALVALAKAREGCWGQWQERTGEQGVQQGRQPPWGPRAAVITTRDARSTHSRGLLPRPSGLPERTSSERSSQLHSAGPGHVGARERSLNGGAHQPRLCVLPGTYWHRPLPSVPWGLDG